MLPNRRTRSLLILALGWFAGVLGCGMVTLAGLPQLQLSHPFAAMAAAFIPYGVLAWLLALWVVSAQARGGRRVLLLPVLAGLAAQVAWTTPYWPHKPKPAVGVSATVMTANLYYGRVDLNQLTQRILEQKPDIVVLQEATSATASVLSSYEWRGMFPFRVGEPSSDWHATNMIVLSRHPLQRVVDSAVDAPVHVVRAHLPAGPATVIAVHATNPTVNMRVWQADLARVAEAVQLASDTPTIAVGDFNAVREHAPMQVLLNEGMRDAAESASVGWLPTFPANSLVPLIAIDHVLVNSHVEAITAWTWPIAGTDHLGLTARLMMEG